MDILIEQGWRFARSEGDGCHLRTRETDARDSPGGQGRRTLCQLEAQGEFEVEKSG